VDKTLFLKTDVLIIGAGPGGYVAAIHAKKQGLDVVLVEREFIGGTCLNIGCIPTKALIHATDFIHHQKEAATYGIDSHIDSIDLSKLINKKDQIVKQLVQGIEHLLSKHGVRVLRGNASFLHDEEVVVSTQEGLIHILAKNTIIATGSKTKHLSIPGISLPTVVDSTGLLQSTKQVSSLTIIGGGIIGLEFAFIYGKLGIPVTVLEFLPSILPSIDKDVSSRLLRFAKQANITILTNSQVKKIEMIDGRTYVHYQSNQLDQVIETDLVLEAVGRVPNIEGLELHSTSVIHSIHGIPVNEFCQTSNKAIYAIGDVTNLWQLAHVASHQGVIAINHILGHEESIDPGQVPFVIFTSPVIASIGYNESQLKEKNIPYVVKKTPYSASGKAIILDQPTGFVKLLVDAEQRKILGATIFGPDAESLIAIIGVQMKGNVPFETIQKTIFSHPTTSELIHEAYLGIDHLAIHYLD
jgi:dihydrolipoamide dehydrogenase